MNEALKSVFEEIRDGKVLAICFIIFPGFAFLFFFIPRYFFGSIAAIFSGNWERLRSLLQEIQDALPPPLSQRYYSFREWIKETTRVLLLLIGTGVFFFILCVALIFLWALGGDCLVCFFTAFGVWIVLQYVFQELLKKIEISLLKKNPTKTITRLLTIIDYSIHPYGWDPDGRRNHTFLIYHYVIYSLSLLAIIPFNWTGWCEPGAGIGGFIVIIIIGADVAFLFWRFFWRSTK